MFNKCWSSMNSRLFHWKTKDKRSFRLIIFSRNALKSYHTIASQCWYLSNMPRGWHFSRSSCTSLSCNEPVTISTTLSIMCPYLSSNEGGTNQVENRQLQESAYNVISVRTNLQGHDLTVEPFHQHKLHPEFKTQLLSTEWHAIW